MTKLEIINLALHHLGCDRLSVLTGNNKRTEVMNDIYDACRDQVLEDGGWSFAKKRATLTALTTAPAFEWESQFATPVDFIKVWKEYEDAEVVHEGNYLLSNASTLSLVYIFRNEDPTTYSPGFIKALSYRLASVASYSLSQDKEIKKMLESEYSMALSFARTNDSQSNTNEEYTQDAFFGDRV